MRQMKLKNVILALAIILFLFLIGLVPFSVFAFTDNLPRTVGVDLFVKNKTKGDAIWKKETTIKTGDLLSFRFLISPIDPPVLYEEGVTLYFFCDQGLVPFQLECFEGTARLNGQSASQNLLEVNNNFQIGLFFTQNDINKSNEFIIDATVNSTRYLSNERKLFISDFRALVYRGAGTPASSGNFNNQPGSTGFGGQNASGPGLGGNNTGSNPAVLGAFTQAGSSLSVPSALSGEFIKRIKNISSDNGREDYAEAGVGDIIRYSIALDSSKSFSGARIEDSLPSAVSFISASDGGAYSKQTNSIRWDIGSITAPQKEYFYEVKVLSSAKDGEVYANSAILISNSFNLKSNSANFEIYAPKFKLTKEIQVEANQGAKISYLIKYVNTGRKKAKATITEEYSQYLKFESASVSPKTTTDGRIAVFDVFDVGPSESGVITLTVAVDPSAPLNSAVGTLTRLEFFDEKGNKYPDLNISSVIMVIAGAANTNRIIQIAPDEGNPAAIPGENISDNNNMDAEKKDGMVKGILDIQAGSYENIIIAVALAKALTFAIYFLWLGGLKKMRIAFLTRKKQPIEQAVN